MPRRPTCWVYRKVNEGPNKVAQFEVGYYGPDGLWISDSLHVSLNKAAGRSHFLNGGGMIPKQEPLSEGQQQATQQERRSEEEADPRYNRAVEDESEAA